VAGIKSINSIDYSGWQLCYDIDFGDYSSSGAMADDDTITIKGVTWTANSSSYGGPEINSSGLVLSPQNGSGFYNSTPADAPTLSANISDIVPQLNSGSTICIQWTIDYSVDSGNAYPDHNYEGVGVTMWDGANNGSWHGIGLKSYNNDTYGGNLWCPWKGAGTELNNGSQAGNYNSFEIVWTFDTQTGIVSAPIAGSEVLDPPLSASVRRAYIPGAYGTNSFWTKQNSWVTHPDVMTIDNSKVLLYSQTENATSAARGFKGIIKRFRMFSVRADYRWQ